MAGMILSRHDSVGYSSVQFAAELANAYLAAHRGRPIKCSTKCAVKWKWEGGGSQGI